MLWGAAPLDLPRRLACNPDGGPQRDATAVATEGRRGEAWAGRRPPDL